MSYRSQSIDRARSRSSSSSSSRSSSSSSSLQRRDSSISSDEGRSEIELFVNYVRIETTQEMEIHQYQVVFEPEVESVKMRRQLLSAHRLLFGQAFLFDGGSDIKSLTHLPGVTELLSQRESDGAQIRLSVSYIGTVSWESFEVLRFINTQIRKNMEAMKYIRIGRNLFLPKAFKEIPQYKLELWQGILTAVNQHVAGTMMVCHTLNRVVRTDTMLAQLKEIRKQSSVHFVNNARRQLAGVIFMTKYNNRTYRAHDIDFEKKPTDEFIIKDRTLTYVTYYREQYNIDIQDLNQPLIVVQPSQRDLRAGKTRNLYFIPELCTMTGLTEDLKNDFRLKREMIQATQIDPRAKFDSLRDFVTSMSENESVQQEMSQWNLQIGQIVKVDAVVLPREALEISNDQCVKIRDPGDFSRNLHNQAMKEPPSTISKWAVIATTKIEGDTKLFLNEFRTQTRKCGLMFETPAVIYLPNDRTMTYTDACKRVIQDHSVQLIITILPTPDKARYDAIKNLLNCDQAVISQVVLHKTIRDERKLSVICVKIAIQIGTKMGGVPWTIKIPAKLLMVIGFDSHRSGSGSYVAGYVSSTNISVTKYYSKTFRYGEHEEMSHTFVAKFRESIERFTANNNGLYPNRIVVYRVGVSEGDIDAVNDLELGKLTSVLDENETTKAIKLSFVVVNKRSHARFFAPDEQPNGNARPGTVVDQIIPRVGRSEFFLVSQSVRHGTVSPTSYNILAPVNLPLAHHQTLAYKLCHLYFNWMGTIRVPAPCQYAYKLAFLTATHLHRDANQQLANKLYFI
ncbi:Piwi-like protein 4 [Halotydeus destructor]|nr:Piwi-like protein 4 [Halotydeus destructor]